MSRAASSRAILDTRFCDYRNPRVHALAEQIARSAEGPRELAQAAFAHIRDHILFGLDLWQVTASETLRKGYGMCSNKALLLAAVLRHQGVPAGLAWVPMYRDALTPALGKMVHMLPAMVNHVIAQVLLEGQWISVDLTLDRATYEAFFRPAGVSWEIDWDGADDCLIFTEYIAGDVNACADIDDALRANADNKVPPRLIAAPALRLANEIMWHTMDRAGAGRKDGA